MTGSIPRSQEWGTIVPFPSPLSPCVCSGTSVSGIASHRHSKLCHSEIAWLVLVIRSFNNYDFASLPSGAASTDNHLLCLFVCFFNFRGKRDLLLSHLFICQSFQYQFLKFSCSTNEHDIFLKNVDWNSLSNQGRWFKKDTKYHRFTLKQLLSKLSFINM